MKMYPNIMGGDMPSCLTPEEQKELMRRLDEMGGWVRGDDPSIRGKGTGRAPSEQSDVHINW